jgi:hypothetical protein
MVLTLRYVFCTDLRTNRDIYLTRHLLIGFIIEVESVY